jgi:zinc finger SWIM domain-containing protein 3
MFDLVRWSIDAVSKCFISGILHEGDLTVYVVAKKDKRDNKFEVRHEELNSSSYRISCSYRKLECLGTPCSHILYMLGRKQVKQLPWCCVPARWTMSAKCAYPLSKKNEMYNYSISLERCRELRNLSHTACFRAYQSDEAYQRLKMVMNAQADDHESTSDKKKPIRFGSVLPQTV